MKREVRIKVGELEVKARFNETDTATKVFEILPITSNVNIWGDEIYFSIPVKIELGNARAVVSEGDLGYWPPGTAFCIFFGSTPMSRGDEIRPASPVNVFGRITGDSKIFKKVTPGARIIIEKVE